MLHVIQAVGPIAGLTDLLDVKLLGALAGFAAFIGVAILAMLSFGQARDLRRLREWAGSAPERDAGLQEATSTIAAERSEELRKVEEERRRQEEAQKAEERAAAMRKQRRQRRERGLPEETRWERIRSRVGGGGGGRMPAPRYLALIVGAVIVLGGGVAFAALQVFGGNGEDHKNASAKSGPHPGEIEVAVLNGTAVSGLAGRFGDELEHDGFQLGAVTNSTTSFASSVVMFDRGHKPEARKVAKALKIQKVELISPDVASAAAGAQVAVVVGEDRASSPPSA